MIDPFQVMRLVEAGGKNVLSSHLLRNSINALRNSPDMKRAFKGRSFELTLAPGGQMINIDYDDDGRSNDIASGVVDAAIKKVDPRLHWSDTGGNWTKGSGEIVASGEGVEDREQRAVTGEHKAISDLINAAISDLGLKVFSVDYNKDFEGDVSAESYQIYVGDGKPDGLARFPVWYPKRGYVYDPHAWTVGGAPADKYPAKTPEQAAKAIHKVCVTQMERRRSAGD